MQQARMIGNYIEYLAEKQGLSMSDIGNTIGCKESQVTALYKGRALATFQQITDLANQLKVSVSELLNGDSTHYNETVVHCMNQFQNDENREKILDIIDDYMDIFDAVEQ